jgi:serine/threonine protein kinase
MSPADFGKWKILGSLSEGGQAFTYKVRLADGSDEAVYVLKRLKNVANPQRLARFQQEIEILQQLNHANIVKVVDHDLTGTKPYYVMEYCDGGSLEDHKTRWAGDPVRTLRMFAVICDAVYWANIKDVIHRDIKPSNILLRSDGSPVVADFGIAYVDQQGVQRLTETQEAVGARLFIPPEWEDGRTDEVYPQGDIYSLGKVLYWMLNGGEMFAREAHREPKWDLVKRRGNVQFERVNRMLDRMIHHDLRRRYPVAGDAVKESRFIANLIEQDYRVVSAKLPALCTYCGMGEYSVIRSETPTAVHNFGFQSVGGARWRIMTCDHCGHVQLFRLDLADDPEVWNQ